MVVMGWTLHATLGFPKGDSPSDVVTLAVAMCMDCMGLLVPCMEWGEGQFN